MKALDRVLKRLPKRDYNKDAASITRFARQLGKKVSVKELGIGTVGKLSGLEISESPTEWVVLWGPCILLGASKEGIMGMFNPPPLEIRLYERSYCAVKFSNAKDAAQAKLRRNATDFSETQSMYILYLSKEPPAEELNLLKPFGAQWPNGLTLYEDFIHPKEEKKILKTIGPRAADRARLEALKLQEPWGRYFGFEYTYGDPDSVIPARCPALPACTMVLVERLMEKELFPQKPDQLTVNYFQPGHGIHQHVDLHSAFEDTIGYVNLTAPAVMEFMNADKLVHIMLPERSLLILKDEARLQWTYGIARRKFDIISDSKYGGITTRPRQPRYSLTFRLMRTSKLCTCKFSSMCDSQGAKIIKRSDDIDAKWMSEYELAVRIFEKSQPLSQTRSQEFSSWPLLKTFINSFNPTKALIQIGTDDGKYFNLQNYSYQECPSLISGNLVNGNIMALPEEDSKPNYFHPKLPYDNGTFDAAICVAVLDQLRTKEMRLVILNEMMRVLKVGAEALIYAKANLQKTDKVRSVLSMNENLKAIVLNPHGPKLSGPSPLKNYSFLPNYDYDFPQRSRMLPWARGGRSYSTLQSQSNVFNQEDLEELVLQIQPRPKIHSYFYDKGNWCARIIKTISE